MKKLRILYLHQYFKSPDEAGGTRSYDISKRLVEKGHEVIMVTSSTTENKNGDKWEKTNIGGIDVYSFHQPAVHYLSNVKRVLRFIEFAFQSYFLSKKLAFDLVFATSTPLTITIPGMLVAKRKKKPMMLEIRDLWPDVPIHLGVLKNPILIWMSKKLEMASYNFAKYIFVFSPRMKDLIIEKGIKTEKVIQNFNGADVEFFKKYKSLGQELLKKNPQLVDKKIIGYIGTLGLVNNVEYLINLAEKIYYLDQNIQIVIVGDGKKRTEIEELAKNKGIYNKNVHFVGEVIKKDIGKWMDVFDVTIATLKSDPYLWQFSFPNKFHDSMAAGKPVITNHLYGGKAEYIKKYNLGILIDDDLDNAARIIVEKISDENWLTETSKNAKNAGEELFSRKKVVEVLNEYFIKSLSE